MSDSMKGKRILVIGLGKSGVASFDALLKEGALPAVYDDRDIKKEDPLLFEKLKKTESECFLGGKPVTGKGWDLFVLSPGVPLSLPFITEAKNAGTKIIGELELAYILGHGKYAAITGTNGKTTTTTLIGGLFSSAGLKTVTCGNIGRPVVTESTRAGAGTWLVTEVSSFQLETIDRFRPKIAVLLNLTPDHMDRHGDMENYAAAKARVFENQEADDILVYNADDDLVSMLAAGARSTVLPFSRKKILKTGAFVKEGNIVFAGSEDEEPICVMRADSLRIPGSHNLENALAGVAVSFAAGIKPDVIAKTLMDFKGVEHRIEFVAEIGGIRFVNDSKGTNPDASVKAIEAMGDNILLIAGGYNKDADFSEYVRAAKGRVKKFLLLGDTAGIIKECALGAGFPDKDIVMAGGMGEAVRLGYECASAGDTILLSPACASWDMYENYEERGAHFKEAVKKLEAGK